MEYASEQMKKSIKKRQRMLIPVNIVICILCIVAIITLYFYPILKVDIGKIVADDAVSEYISETFIQSSSANAASDKNGNSTYAAAYAESSSSDDSEALSSLIAPVLKTVLKTLGDKNIALEITPKQASKCAFDSSTNSIRELLDEVLFDEKNGFITDLVEGIKDVLNSEDNTKEIENSALTGVAQYATEKAKANLDKDSEAYEALNSLTDDQINSIVSTLDELDTVENEDDFKEVISDALDKIEELTNGNYQVSDDDKQKIIDENLLPLYQETLEEIEEYNSTVENDDEKISFSLETFLCVQLSKNVDLNDLLNGNSSSSTSENKKASAASYAYVTYIDGGDDVNEDDENDENTENTGNSDSEGDSYHVYFTYSEIVNDGLSSDTLSTDLQQKFDESFETSESSAEIAEILSMVMKGLFLFICVFIAIWAIQFLFAFIHIFTGNRFVGMWYTKLFCWIPVLLWAITSLLSDAAAVNLICNLIGYAKLTENAAVIVGVFSGITSFTFLSGICYVLLWLVSIFWAFPIKRSIRRLKKENRQLLRNAQKVRNNG